MFVPGLAPEQTGDPALTSGYINPRIDPSYYQDADNLGFSLKSIAKGIKKVASPVQKLAGKVSKPVLKVAGRVASPLTSIGAGILRNVPGGGLLVGAASGVKNLVTGNKAKAVQRLASKTVQSTITALPIQGSRSDGWNGVDYTGGAWRGPAVQAPMATVTGRPSIGTQLQRFKADPAGTILRAGARVNRQARGVAAGVASTADKATAVAAAADAAAAAGDALGSRRLSAVAQRLAELARSGADTATNVQQALQTGGAAAEGAAAGAVTGAAAEQGSQWIDSIPGGKLTVGAAAVGLGWALLRGHGGGGGSRRRGGEMAVWE